MTSQPPARAKASADNRGECVTTLFNPAPSAYDAVITRVSQTPNLYTQNVRSVIA